MHFRFNNLSGSPSSKSSQFLNSQGDKAFQEKVKSLALRIAGKVLKGKGENRNDTWKKDICRMEPYARDLTCGFE